MNWWDTLPLNYRTTPDKTAVHRSDPIKVYSSAALDHVGRSGLGALAVTAMGPLLATKAKFRAENRRLDFYRQQVDEGDVDRLFPMPERVAVERRPGRKLPRSLADISCTQLRARSDFQPLSPELRESYLAQRQNGITYAEHWTHTSGPRPTLIVVHGYLLDSAGFYQRLFDLPRLYREGYDILLVTLPFHGPRAERFAPWSGYGYLARGISGFNEAICHSIYDLRLWMNYLQDSGVPAMGITGLSLGGYLSALLPAVDNRLAFAMPNSPLVSPIDMCLEWLPIRMTMLPAMRRAGISLPELRHGVALHSPLSWPSRIAAERLFVIGGAGDRFTAPRYVRLLQEHWQGKNEHWFPGNHLMHWRREVYIDAMLAFMQRYF